MTKFVDPKIIQRELNKDVKNSNFYYSKAKQSRIKDRKSHDQNKKTKQLRKSLSKDRFNQYLDTIYKQNDNS